MDTATACEWTVNGLRIAGLSWGEPGGRPVLALHGWLDNAASFARLAPLLDGCHVVALDLTGHGLSDRRSADASYQIWDDLPEIFGVVTELGWEEFDLLGHSRGGIIAMLFAAAFPERVRRLILLDALIPAPFDATQIARQIRSALLDKTRLLRRENRVFASQEEAIRSRESRGLPRTVAEPLSRRNLRPCDGGYTWTTDSRLHGASAMKLSEAHIHAALAALTMPVLLILAAGEPTEKGAWIENFAREHIADLEVDKINGGHHFHMEENVQWVAERILIFLENDTAAG